MPASLWRAAIEWAKREGASPVARTLGIDYGAVKRRSARGLDPRARGGDLSFVELPLTAERAADSLEITARDGARMVCRFSGTPDLDLGALAALVLGKR